MQLYNIFRTYIIFLEVDCSLLSGTSKDNRPTNHERKTIVPSLDDDDRLEILCKFK